ncbi:MULTISPECIES: chemotaxis protein CheW [unclassified Methylomonas]|uniref:chemotaxis protein CheW n=1 Tax=unclassified Methylomonas TaxID=2608980 RepID=UPI0008D95223|nr:MULTISPECIES: chemotaxis protein CheW [unclassified Methylomonas]OHX38303.1 chemotaxis protein CheW [Methylomonas sp. LWB]WGS86585.1 chemotaxis protein CheW [Methylomonas sp. UP202]
MKQAKPPPRIVQQQLALDAYLQTLLEVVPEADEADLATVAPAEQRSVQTLAPDVAVQAEKALIRLPESALVALENPAKLQALTVMPDWALTEFQALFFKVDQLILAAPLVDLARTIRLERKPGKIPGQPSWFLGLLDDQDSRIGVLDTGQLVFGKTRGQQRNLEERPFKCVLVTQDKKWGLACDEILSIGKLKPEKVRWRTVRRKRPWLIGTVIEELTAIVDVKQLVPHRKPQ